MGGVSALGAGLFSLGIPKNSVVKYETSIKAGKFVLVAHGTAAEVAKARDLLKTSGAEQIDSYESSTEQRVRRERAGSFRKTISIQSHTYHGGLIAWAAVV